MGTELYVLAALAALTVLYLTLLVIGKAYRRYRGKRLVFCPETHEPAGVEIDAKHAALTAATGQPNLRLKECSRWPEREDCDQECLQQIELAPAGCLVRTVIAKWYEGKSCVLCGKGFGEITWSDHKPALMTLERRTFEWDEIRAEAVPDALSTHLPVCWNCHIAETFRRQYPDLVVDRPWKRGST